MIAAPISPGDRLGGRRRRKRHEFTPSGLCGQPSMKAGAKAARRSGRRGCSERSDLNDPERVKRGAIGGAAHATLLIIVASIIHTKRYAMGLALRATGLRSDQSTT
jgi:hypothetical protein